MRSSVERKATPVSTAEPNCEPNSMVVACDALAAFLDSISDDELEVDPGQGKEINPGEGGKNQPDWQTLSDQKRVLTVNDTLMAMVIKGPTSMGIPNAHSFVTCWSNKCFHAMANFVEGCEYVKLDCKWVPEQIKAFMDYLYDKHYAVSILDAQWSTLHLVGKTLGERIPTQG